MAITPRFQGRLLERLGEVTEVTARRMFGGLGLWADGLFFALADDDVLYFKADEASRGEFERRGCRPFRPFGEDGYAMGYYAAPAGALDDPVELARCTELALAAARRARAKKRRPASRRS